MMRATLLVSTCLMSAALPPFIATDPSRDCIQRGGQNCMGKDYCPKELSRNFTSYKCPASGCCEKDASPTNAPAWTAAPQKPFCTQECTPDQNCPDGSKCPKEGCCKYAKVTPAPFEDHSIITIKVLTDNWDSGAFVKALANASTMKEIGGWQNLDARLSFFRTTTSSSDSQFKLEVNTALDIQPKPAAAARVTPEEVSVAQLENKIQDLVQSKTTISWTETKGSGKIFNRFMLDDLSTNAPTEPTPAPKSAPPHPTPPPGPTKKPTPPPGPTKKPTPPPGPTKKPTPPPGPTKKPTPPPGPPQNPTPPPTSAASTVFWSTGVGMAVLSAIAYQ